MNPKYKKADADGSAGRPFRTLEAAWQTVPKFSQLTQGIRILFAKVSRLLGTR